MTRIKPDIETLCLVLAKLCQRLGITFSHGNKPLFEDDFFNELGGLPLLMIHAKHLLISANFSEDLLSEIDISTSRDGLYGYLLSVDEAQATEATLLLCVAFSQHAIIDLRDTLMRRNSPALERLGHGKVAIDGIALLAYLVEHYGPELGLSLLKRNATDVKTFSPR